MSVGAAVRVVVAGVAAGVPGAGVVVGVEMVYLSAALAPLLMVYWMKKAVIWVIEMALRIWYGD
jgi:hypothetical protein